MKVFVSVLGESFEIQILTTFSLKRALIDFEIDIFIFLKVFVLFLGAP